MWNQNFLFRAHESVPLDQSEGELFHDTEPAMDSAGLNLETYVSIWVQGDGDDVPSSFTNVYVRTATLDSGKQAGFLQPLQGRTHQIKALLTSGQKSYVKDWLRRSFPEAWEATDDHLRDVFDEP